MRNSAFLTALFLALLGAIPLGSLSAQGPRGENREEEQEPNLARDLFNRFRGRNEITRQNEALRTTFRSVVAPAQASVVRVLVDGKQVALGTVVAAEGLILTKASEAASGDLVCELADGRKLPARVVGMRSQHDLALLQVDATDLHPISWIEGDSPVVGSWLATPGPGEDPISIGVMSVAVREVRAPSGLLGVQLKDGDEVKGAVIEQVMSDTGAAEAGLQVDDIVLRLNGKEIANREELIAGIKSYQPGDRVRLLVQRGNEQLNILATLGSPERGARGDRREFQNNLGGSLSIRRAGFPSVLQHDSILQPNECGGPICDLDGRAVGVNIARAGRVNSYAVPASVVQFVVSELRAEGAAAKPSAEELKMQQLARRIESLQSELGQTQSDLGDAADAADDAAATLDAARRRAEELTGQINELRKQLEAARLEQEKLLKQ